MKINKVEQRIINNRRRFIKVKRKNEKLISFRKSAKQSKGEERIAAFLGSELVEFKTEWFFKGLYNYSKSSLLFFDFYLPKYNLCIEYDGQQHYGSKKTEAQKMNDFLKNAYCVKNKVWFLRIKYTQFNEIEKLICAMIDKITIPVYAS